MPTSTSEASDVVSSLDKAISQLAMLDVAGREGRTVGCYDFDKFNSIRRSYNLF